MARKTTKKNTRQILAVEKRIEKTSGVLKALHEKLKCLKEAPESTEAAQP
jgi:hypothetical protein